MTPVPKFKALVAVNDFKRSFVIATNCFMLRRDMECECDDSAPVDLCQDHHDLEPGVYVCEFDATQRDAYDRAGEVEYDNIKYRPVTHDDDVGDLARMEQPPLLPS